MTPCWTADSDALTARERIAHKRRERNDERSVSNMNQKGLLDYPSDSVDNSLIRVSKAKEDDQKGTSPLTR